MAQNEYLDPESWQTYFEWELMTFNMTETHMRNTTSLESQLDFLAEMANTVLDDWSYSFITELEECIMEWKELNPNATLHDVGDHQSAKIIFAKYWEDLELQHTMHVRNGYEQISLFGRAYNLNQDEREFEKEWLNTISKRNGSIL